MPVDAVLEDVGVDNNRDDLVRLDSTEDVEVPWAHGDGMAARALRRLLTHEDDEFDRRADSFGPLSMVALMLSSIGMLGVGFRLGYQREMRQEFREEAPKGFAGRILGKFGISSGNKELQQSSLSLRERANLKKGLVMAKGNQGESAVSTATLTSTKGLTKRHPDAARLAMKALGYSTVLTLSTATFTLVAGKWYFNISSTDDLIWRLKKNVPLFSLRLQGVVLSPLNRLRDNMQAVFGKVGPMIEPSKGSASGSTIEEERDALIQMGISPIGILDPEPTNHEKTKNSP